MSLGIITIKLQIKKVFSTLFNYESLNYFVQLFFMWTSHSGKSSFLSPSMICISFFSIFLYRNITSTYNTRLSPFYSENVPKRDLIHHALKPPSTECEKLSNKHTSHRGWITTLYNFVLNLKFQAGTNAEAFKDGSSFVGRVDASVVIPSE